MLPPADLERLRLLISSRSVRHGRFTLASGRTSTFYFNGKPTMLHPLGAELIARAMLAVAREVGATHLSGLEMGAVPLLGAVSALSSIEGTPIPATFVRKMAKAHGTGELVEGLGPGETLAGARVLLLEDVVTTGGSVLKAAAALRNAGGEVAHAAVIVDREEGGVEALGAQGIRLHPIFRAGDFAPSLTGSAA